MRSEGGGGRFHTEAQLYCLVIEHEIDEPRQVGALGSVHWPKGWTYYVGRARRGWGTRLKRFTKPFTNHWHVDYLVSSPHARCRYLAPVGWDADRECELVSLARRCSEGRTMAKGLGSSDCDGGCEAHGWYGSRSPGAFLPDLSRKSELTGWIEFRPDRCRWQAAPK